MNPGAGTERTGGYGGEARRSPVALVQTIEGEIIPRLLLAHGAAPSPNPSRQTEASHTTAQDVEALAEMALETDAGEVADSLAARRSAGAPLESIYLDLVAPAARLLGAWWDDDRCSFTDVTLGLCRLQQAVRELGEGRIWRGGGDKAPRALFAPAPGEQHVLGLTMIEELFRKAGWRTDCAPVSSPDEVVRRVGSAWCDLVGFTLSTADRADALRALATRIRAASLNADIRIIAGGGGVAGLDDPAARLGVDAVAQDGRCAVLTAGRMMAQRRQPVE